MSDKIKERLNEELLKERGVVIGKEDRTGVATQGNIFNVYIGDARVGELECATLDRYILIWSTLPNQWHQSRIEALCDLLPVRMLLLSPSNG